MDVMDLYRGAAHQSCFSSIKVHINKPRDNSLVPYYVMRFDPSICMKYTGNRTKMAAA